MAASISHSFFICQEQARWQCAQSFTALNMQAFWRKIYAHNTRAGCLFFAGTRLPFLCMDKTVIEVQVRAVLPTSGGCAVFLGNNDKVFIIYVDQTVGSAIT